MRKLRSDFVRGEKHRQLPSNDVAQTHPQSIFKTKNCNVPSLGLIGHCFRECTRDGETGKKRA